MTVPPWVSLMSLDVVTGASGSDRVTFRYSADGAAGAFTGEVDVLIGEPGQMVLEVFDCLRKHLMRLLGSTSQRSVATNVDEIGLKLEDFLAGLGRVLRDPDPEPMELAIARTDGIDFMSRTVSLHDKEIPERIEILLRRAESNLRHGFPEEALRLLSKIELLDPGNARAFELRAQIGGPLTAN